MQATVYMIAGYFYLVHTIIYDCVETGQKLYTISRSSLNFGRIFSHFRGSKFQTVHNSRFEAFP